MANRTIAQCEKEIVSSYKTALDAIRVKMVRLYEKYSTDGKLTYAEMTKYNRLATMEAEIIETLKGTTKEVTKNIDRLIAENYEQSFFRTAWAVDQSTGIGLKWGLINKETIKAAVKNDLYHLAKKGLAETSLVAVNRTVVQGLIQGQSMPKMGRAIAKALDRSLSDGLRIARTEGLRAVSLGELSAIDRAKDRGVQVKTRWVASLDDKTRDSHRALDGTYKDDENGGWYVPGLGYVAGPRLSGSPGFDINCRCDVAPEIEGLEPTLRRTKEGVVPYTNYEDWHKNMVKNGGTYKPERYITLPEETVNKMRNESN